VPPLNDESFSNWKFAMSSVALENKIILSPTGKDQYGFMQNLWTFEATSWEMTIDFAIDYESERAEYAKGDMQVYLLKNVPLAVGTKRYKLFGEGLER